MYVWTDGGGGGVEAVLSMHLFMTYSGLRESDICGDLDDIFFSSHTHDVCMV